MLLASGKTHFIYDRVMPKARKQAGNLIAETTGNGPATTVREYIYLPETEIAPSIFAPAFGGTGSRTVLAEPSYAWTIT